MLSETASCLKAVPPLCYHRLCAHGAVSRRQQPHRHFGLSLRHTAKVPPPRRPREKVDIPGLEVVTYGERMHYVPGLAKPAYPDWKRDYQDPRFYKSPPLHDMPLYKERPCYIFNNRTSALEGQLVPTRNRTILATGSLGDTASCFFSMLPLYIGMFSLLNC